MQIIVVYNAFEQDEKTNRGIFFEVSDDQYKKLEYYKKGGQKLDQVFLSSEMTELHGSIIKSIKEDIEKTKPQFLKKDNKGQDPKEWFEKYRTQFGHYLQNDLFFCEDNELIYELDLEPIKHDFGK